MKNTTLYINIHNGFFGPEAHDRVHTDRAEAADAAEQYASTYAFTVAVTDANKIDLTAEFSEEYHENVASDEATDAKIDELKSERLAYV
ncbi:MAG TPA: hypothetical protein VHW09_27040 [Bryobacteraceae bacterium]|jgi:hypothetical protein|nr:hypothetical protein [Bryobacteraceae bacterium]